MVTEAATNATKSKATSRKRPTPVHSWTNSDVQKWYRRCGNNPKYADLFQKHDITGLTLLRMTDHALLRMGIEDNKDREAIWREILKQKLKADIMEIRDLERMEVV
ncbi:protein aveugle [Phlebotomus argentipes]|uniref:protein aveugle n=1 Tax=Phlebotomus argentipes TaxID=94469 RepID=UPI002893236D|nr:protein aveugle [Phlebotomus argentipes]